MRPLALLLALAACSTTHEASTIGNACPIGVPGCVEAYPQRVIPPAKPPRWKPPIMIPAGLLETELGAKALHQGDVAVCE